MESNELNISLELLKDDLKSYNDMLKEISNDILVGGYSEFPIFIAHQDEVKIGDLVIDASEHGKSFNISVAVLEDLEAKQIITTEKKQDFIAAFKNPKEFICVLLVTDKLANFVFVPFNKLNSNE